MPNLKTALNEAAESLREQSKKCLQNAELLERLVGAVSGDESPVLWCTAEPYRIVLYAANEDMAGRQIAGTLAALLEAQFEKQFNQYSGNVKFTLKKDGLLWEVWGKPGPECHIERVVTPSTYDEVQYKIVCD